MEKPEGKSDEAAAGADASAESCDVPKHLLPVAVSSSQDGEQAASEALAPEQESAGRRRNAASPATQQRPADEAPRLHFQIPRKNKERKALFQHIATGSREFEDLVKILSSCYRDTTSAGTFAYTKARLIHSELLEKDFIEKRRELKQDGRTDKELSESYCFLLPDLAKLHTICEKGLTVGHSRISILGNPAMGVYLSKYSDLLQMNPFDPGASGEIIIFKVMKGKVKSIYENISKNVLDPTPKFDCHVSKNAAKVTSLRSYRAFELTQQYFYEYSFDEIKSRPRHVCPYSVVSFLYKGKEGTPPPKPTAPIRSISGISDGPKGRCGYTVWSGQLLNGGRTVHHVCLQSRMCPFLPFKLPEKLEIGTVMDLDQVKRKIPAILFSLDTYCGVREVLKSGMYCSLFEVMDRGKPGTGLSGLLQKLERERMVLVNTLVDKGFLFLLSSSQMVSSIDRRADRTRSLQALFVFQEPRGVTKFLSKRPTAQDVLVSGQKEPVMPQLDTFVPALHYALMKVRLNPPPDLAAGVQRQARDYLSGCSGGKVRLYYMTDYQQNLDGVNKLRPVLWRGHNRERCLRSYLYGPSFYLLPVRQAKEMMESSRCPPEYSPVSDWEGSDGQPSDGKQAAVVARSNGAHGPQATSADNDPEKMKELLRLIQMCKRNFEGDGRLAAEGRDATEEGVWDSRAPKRKLEPEAAEGAVKYLRADLLDNAEHSRVMNSMGVRDTYLRKEEAVDAVRPAGSRGGPASIGGGGREALEYDMLTQLGLPAQHHADLQNRPTAEVELDGQEPAASGAETPEAFSPCSIGELQPRGSELPGDEQVPWSLIPITDDDDAVGAHFPKPQLVSDSVTTEGTRNGLSEPAAAADGHMDAEAGDEWAETLSPGRKAAFDRLDNILDRELDEFSTEMHSLLSGERVRYTPDLSTLVHRPSLWMPMVPFSEYVSDYVPPVPVQSYVSALCERMTRVMDSEAAQGRTHTPPCGLGPVPTCTVSPNPSPSLLPPTVSASPSDPTPTLASQPGPLTTSPQRRRHQGLPQISQVPPRVQKVPGVPRKPDPDPPKPTRREDGVIAANRSAAKPEPIPPALEPVSGPAHGSGPNSISSLISQLKPEVFSSLVEIIKDVRKNTVKFYIHSQEESDVCVEIKEYLMRLGNAECNPQSFLESKNNLDKLLIIIQNEDIAAHVHKIPALVSLKKLPSVSFAGVDSLDDVKNHTYNELFISGGFIVSDEFVLNPDFITYEKLQAFLKFLEEQSSPDNIWQWKVHCKSQKKLKELGRLNGDALSLLTLLTTYQKRHLVEFLPYHECDGPSRHAPDLDCLVRLQAHHTQHRHTIFLTERRFEMFPHYSNNGIVIATMDDMMNSFHSLIGFHDGKENVPVVEHPAESERNAGKEEVKDECVEEEDMSLDSEEESPLIERPDPQLQEESTDLPLPPPPPSQEFCPPLPKEPARDTSPEQLDMDALNTAICHFQASAQAANSLLDFEVGGASPGAFNVNPHQSFLCPVPLPTPSSNSSGAQTRSASPYCASQEQDCRLTSSTPPPNLMPSASQGNMTPAPTPAAAILNSPVPCPPLPNMGTGGTETTRAVTASLCGPLDQGSLSSSNAMPGPAVVPTGVPPSPAALGQQGPVAPPVPPLSLGMSYFPVGGASSRDDWPPHSWSHMGEVGALGTASGTPTSQEDGSLGPGNSSDAGNGASSTANSQAGATLNSVAAQGGAKLGSLGSITSTQGSSAPLPSAATPRPEPATPVREAHKGSGLLPTPPRLGSINGRGQGLSVGMGMPSNGPRGLLRHGPEPRGPACGWRFPHGRGALRPPTMDFTQDPYPWREEYYKQGEGYRNHRNDYNCW